MSAGFQKESTLRNLILTQLFGDEPGELTTATVSVAALNILLDRMTRVRLASDPAAAEATPSNNPGAFRVTRVGGVLSQPLTVNYTIAGTASPSDDYAALSGVVIIPANQTFALLNVAPSDDVLAEPSESVILTLSASSTYRLGTALSQTATVTIADNEPLVTIAALDATASESGSPPANPGTFRITRTGNLGAPLTVGISRGGTGVFGPTGDYTQAIGNVNFTGTAVVIPAGQASVDITVSPIDNLVPELPETATLTLLTSAVYSLDPVAANRTATVALLDDEVERTAHAVFDHDGAGIFRGLNRCEEDKEAMVAELPIAGLSTLCALDATHLSRTGLAGHPDAVDGKAASDGGACAIHDEVHAITHDLKLLGRKRQARGRLLLAMKQVRLKHLS